MGQDVDRSVPERSGYAIAPWVDSSLRPALAFPTDLPDSPIASSTCPIPAAQRPVLAPRETWPWRRRMARQITVPGLLVLLAVCVAAPLRLVDLAGIPSGLNQDEAVSGYDAWSIFQTGRDHHGHPISLTGLESFGDWASPLLTLLTVPFVGMLGLNVESIRLVSALLGIAAVVVCYFLGRELTGSRVIGVISSWTLALLPVAVHLSRWAIPPTTVPLLVAATLLAMVWALRHRSGFGLIIAAAVAGLAMSGYPALKVYIPLLVLLTVVIYWRDALAILRVEPSRFLLAIGVGGVIAGPIIWLGSRDPGGRARAEQVSALNDPAFGMARLIDAYRSYFSPAFLFLRGDGDGMHLPSGYGALPPFLIPLLAAGVIALLFRVAAPQSAGDRERSLVLLAATALIPLPGALTVPSPHLLRSAQLIPLAAVLSAIGLVAIVRVLWHVTHASLQPASRISVAVMVAAGMLVAGAQLSDQYENYFQVWPDQTATAFQSGGLEAAEYAYVHRSEYDLVYVSGMNQGYIYVLFAGPWDPNQIHDDLIVRRNPPSFNTATEVENVRFTDPPSEATRGDSRVVFEYVRGSDQLFSATAYTEPDGGRVLVVRPV